MTQHYDNPLMIKDIGLLVRRSGYLGVRPSDIHRGLAKLWPGDQIPCVRTIERHIASHPQIQPKPQNAKPRRKRDQSAPFTRGYYVWVKM